MFRSAFVRTASTLRSGGSGRRWCRGGLIVTKRKLASVKWRSFRSARICLSTQHRPAWTA
jgi:hypothetical protein